MITIKYTETTEERFFEMLGIVPPALQDGHGFLVGEPMDHRTCTVTGRIAPTYSAFIESLDGKFFESTEAVTAREYRVAPFTTTLKETA